MIKRLLLLACVLSAILSATRLSAHVSGENYLFLEFLDDSIRGRVEIKVEDLAGKLNLDVEENGKASLAKLEKTTASIDAYVQQHLSMAPSGGSPYPFKIDRMTFFEGEGGWAQYYFTIPASPLPDFLEIEMTTLMESDRMHRALVVTEKGQWPSDDYEMNIAMVFSESNSSQILDVQNPPSVQTPWSMIWQGVLHIWIGIDHILFLVALALPIVLVKQSSVWQPSQGLGSTLMKLLKIVTVFTIAHSITLALASLGLVQLPSRLVESVIALSIALVAINNIIGRSPKTSLVVTFLLGLFHGLGFASVMADLPFRIAELQNLLLIILAFNFGVELGQLGILIVLFPVIFALRKSTLYVPVVLRGGSAVLVLIAGYWFVERAFAL